MNTHVELSRRCTEAGYYPYRLGIQAMQAPAEAESYTAVLGRLSLTGPYAFSHLPPLARSSSSQQSRGNDQHVTRLWCRSRHRRKWVAGLRRADVATTPQKGSMIGMVNTCLAVKPGKPIENSAVNSEFFRVTRRHAAGGKNTSRADVCDLEFAVPGWECKQTAN